MYIKCSPSRNLTVLKGYWVSALYTHVHVLSCDLCISAAAAATAPWGTPATIDGSPTTGETVIRMHLFSYNMHPHSTHVHSLVNSFRLSFCMSSGEMNWTLVVKVYYEITPLSSSKALELKNNYSPILALPCAIVGFFHATCVFQPQPPPPHDEPQQEAMDLPQQVRPL